MPGGDLFSYSERKGTVSGAEVKHIAYQLLRAIEHLHVECGIAHLDIKVRRFL